MEVSCVIIKSMKFTEEDVTQFFSILKEHGKYKLYPLGTFFLKDRAKKRMITLAGEIIILPKHKALFLSLAGLARGR